MQAQDSSDPTGVSGPVRGGSADNDKTLRRARARKADAALSLRLAGATWADIALAVGYPTPRQAMVATERALERQLSTPDDREKMRKMAGARLERLLRSVWSKAIDPDNPDHLVAVSKARDILADHRRLFGLDAPTEVVVHDPTRAELDAWVARVVSGSIGVVETYDVVQGRVIEAG